ncbi:formylglycine-generating enzyme family protein [Paramagnetospirillum magneticum]|uniref:formylglycine-generating enzyme family protein n=1 Tax=Paramagnetospirillum magneticum TaxID=84159 RepID=UPI001E574DAE|nr:formylglycine-generating enzyme family protein [Paramagnetospirillum magneticum]
MRMMSLVAVAAATVLISGIASAEGLKPGQSFKDCEDCPEMVVIPPGSFMMGSSENEKDRYEREGPQHQVVIRKPYSLGRYPVTQGEWLTVMGSEPSNFKGRNRPVEKVSWDDAQQFVRRLSERTGKHYRLPSEAEWEYGARSGTNGQFYWGDDIGSGNANCKSCDSQWDGRETSPVGSFPPNRFGLYDMAGNVWQLTQDCLHENYRGAPSDGTAWEEPVPCRHVLRGGSWKTQPRTLRSANRDKIPPAEINYSVGFRVARDLP